VPRLARKPCALPARLDKPAVAQAGVFPFMLSYIVLEARADGVAERALKIGLSIVAVMLFAAAGFVVAAVRPFHLAGDLHRLSRGPDVGHEAGLAADAPEVPVPPDTELAHSTSTTAGVHYIYRSQLSVEGLVLFYTNEMPRSGWSRDMRFESALAEAPTVLSFKAGRARCIIGLEETEPFATAVNVLVMGAPMQESAGF